MKNMKHPFSSSSFGSSVSLLTAATLLSSCATVTQKIIERPKVDLEKVTLAETNGSGATVHFGVRVDNPNPFALQVDAVRYQVEIAGKPLTQGEINEPARVGAKEATVITIPITVRYADVFSSLFDLMNNKASKYRVRGEAFFGLLRIPFDETGDLKLQP